MNVATRHFCHTQNSQAWGLQLIVYTNHKEIKQLCSLLWKKICNVVPAQNLTILLFTRLPQLFLGLEEYLGIAICKIGPIKGQAH